MTRNVLVVEDDAPVRFSLQKWLEFDGFRVTAIPGGEELPKHLSQDTDLVLLDIGLPDADGLTLTRHIREQHSAGIIILSGRSDLIDRIVGLEAGADDYMTKPFEPREMLARVRSVLRRVNHPVVNARKANSERHGFGEWIVDLGAHTIEDAEGAAVKLTAGEFALLREFVRHPNRILSRDRLIELTCGHDSTAFDRSVDILIGRLRRKLRDNPREQRFIKTIRNGGYMFIARLKRV